MNTNDFLEGLKDQVQDTKDAVQIYFASLEEDQLNWRPNAGSWSIAQCLEHLCIAGEQYLRTINEAIKKGKTSNLYSEEFEYSWFGKKFLNWVKPNSKVNFKAPSNWRPTSMYTAKEIVEDFLELQDQLIKAIENAKGLNLSKLKIKSPPFPLVKFRLGEALEIVVTHQKRHLNQAQGVYQSLEFPKEPVKNN